MRERGGGCRRRLGRRLNRRGRRRSIHARHLLVSIRTWEVRVNDLGHRTRTRSRTLDKSRLHPGQTGCRLGYRSRAELPRGPDRDRQRPVRRLPHCHQRWRLSPTHGLLRLLGRLRWARRICPSRCTPPIPSLDQLPPHRHHSSQWREHNQCSWTDPRRRRQRQDPIRSAHSTRAPAPQAADPESRPQKQLGAWLASSKLHSLPTSLHFSTLHS